MQPPASNLEVTSRGDGIGSLVMIDESLLNDLKSVLGLAELGTNSWQSERDVFLLRLQKELDGFVGHLIMEFSGRRARGSKGETWSIPHAYPIAELIQFFKFLQSGGGLTSATRVRGPEGSSIAKSFDELRKGFWQSKGRHFGVCADRRFFAAHRI